MPKPEIAKRNMVTIDQILRPQTRLDLIFKVDLLNDHIDMRTSTVLDITPTMIVTAQTDPPIVKSMAGRSLEATFVRRDPVTSEMVRWGWPCQLQEVFNYKLREDAQDPVQALAISLPAAGGITETNARMDYRLSIGSDKKISIQTHPSFGRVSLLDFSAGGVLIGIPKPPQAKANLRLWFTLFLPSQTAPGQQTNITGEAEVVWVANGEGEPMAKAGLKFLDLDLSATRTLQKTIMFYMMEEQRQRNRMHSAARNTTEA